ncbi:MAG: hypothetical protein ACE5HI_10805 [bacterium]
MKSDKMVVVTIASTVLLLLLIGWAFYQALQLDSDRKIKIKDQPEKAVMAQVKSMNEARLEEIARGGKVVKGMSMEQVRLALGEPQRIDTEELEKGTLTIWWYQQEGWMNIAFNESGKVNRINPQP